MRIDRYTHDESIKRDYLRRMFLDYPEGLMMILDDHCFWDVITNEEQKYLHNYAVRLLDFLGINAIWNHEEKSEQFIKMLLSLDYIHPEGDTGDDYE